MLTCSGQVKHPFATPSSAASFGRVRRDTATVTKKILLRPGAGGPIKPELVPIQRPGISAELKTIREGALYELAVTLSPPWPNGRLNTSFRIKTGIKQAPMARIRVIADVEARVSTRPPRFVLPLYTGAVERTARVHWSGGGDRHITKASATDPRLSVRIEDHGHYQDVIVSVPKGYVPSVKRVVVTLETDDRQIPVFAVPVRFDLSRRPSGRSASTRRSSRRPPQAKCDPKDDQVQSASEFKSP